MSSAILSDPSSNPYAGAAPSLQQTADLFSGCWASAFPSGSGVRAGSAALFDDPRVEWALSGLEKLGVKTREAAVLELGPLEGGHSYLLSRAGVRSVTAIEAHAQSYLKCLVAKELLGVERVNFLYGDAVEFLRSNQHVYDICFASGFLYHMTDPLELLRLVARSSRSVFLWTVCWDLDFALQHPEVRAGSDGIEEVEFEGRTYALHRHEYGKGLDYSRFWGGPAPFSRWMEREQILEALAQLGFTRQVHETEQNPNGTALRVVAAKS